jgi:diaminohydroxyphosphoribosylaminopyrimidine deaminase/5-amino-6-(5-phosphoribosylamino)uracil reductase
MEIDKKYMERALYLATKGAGHVSPNPMVGAVIVAPDGRIIGEGFHRRYGEAHAEVNAVNSVSANDQHLLPESDIYVTLEPCSHYGKTPPCAKLLCDQHLRRVIIGVGDPNPKVAGRGVKMLREAGIEVIEDFMPEECYHINRRFMRAQQGDRPWILLKWAETETGEMSHADGTPLQISTPVTSALMHRERALCDAIMVGTNTILADNPTLTTRCWSGRSPRPVLFRSEHLPSPESEAGKKLAIYDRDPIWLDPSLPLAENMRILRQEFGITSLMVEGGRKLLQSFIDAKLYDEKRIETAIKKN